MYDKTRWQHRNTVISLSWHTRLFQWNNLNFLLKLGNCVFFPSGESHELLYGKLCTHWKCCRNNPRWKSNKTMSARGSRLPRVVVVALRSLQSQVSSKHWLSVLEKNEFGSFSVLTLSSEPHPLFPSDCHFTSLLIGLIWMMRFPET